MNAFLDSECNRPESNTTNTTIDRKKITIKHIKIKRATRTCLYHIDQWLKDEDIKKIKKNVQKKLATSSQIVNDEFGYALTFNGDHTIVIKDLIIEMSNSLLNVDYFE